MSFSALCTSNDTNDESSGRGRRKKEALDWLEWGRGFLHVVGEFFFQRISASHLENPLPLPLLHDITIIVTGSTSGIGLEISRQLAEAGAHVVMAVRRTNTAHELIQKWLSEKQVLGVSLNIEVMELDLLSLDSIFQFAKIWNARCAPLHALINNAGILALGEARRRQWLEGNPEASRNDESIPFNTSIIPWWVWAKRYYLPDPKLLKGKVAVFGFFAVYFVDSLTTVGLVDQRESFLWKSLLFLLVLGVLLLRKNEDFGKVKKFIEETTSYDNQWKAALKDDSLSNNKN